jgi:hypothetical protein
LPAGCGRRGRTAWFATDPAVRRYETTFVKAEIKNRPVVVLDEGDMGR